MTLTDNTPMRMYAATETKAYTLNGIRLVHHFDDYGNHRLVDGEFQTAESPWTPYPYPAVLVIDGVEYRATTEYWSGTFPRVFKIEEARDA